MLLSSPSEADDSVAVRHYTCPDWTALVDILVRHDCHLSVASVGFSFFTKPEIIVKVKGDILKHKIILHYYWIISIHCRLFINILGNTTMCT